MKKRLTMRHDIYEWCIDDDDSEFFLKSQNFHKYLEVKKKMKGLRF